MENEGTERSEELRQEIAERARAVEPNTQVPGAPTLVGFITAMMDEIAELKERAEILEARTK